ncbi:MAG: hypothetical protein ACLPPV_02890 [Candidatus Korobacteraceae bacterium]|jgi:hypothetical protein
MTTKTLVAVSGVIEVVTGVVLAFNPALVGRVLLDADLSFSGVAVARLCGVGLLSLGLAGWPSGESVPMQVTRALFAYNLLAALYLGYLRVGGGFVSYLLWPACILHALLALLMARPAWKKVGQTA